jgi:hypothetical protein
MVGRNYSLGRGPARGNPHHAVVDYTDGEGFLAMPGWRGRSRRARATKKESVETR